METEPKDPLGAAYGEPAIIVVCGVDVPDGFNETSACEEANRVGWYAPPEQYDDQSADVTIFAVTYRPVVELRLPSDYRPAGLAAPTARSPSWQDAGEAEPRAGSRTALVRQARRTAQRRPVSRASASRISRSTRVG